MKGLHAVFLMVLAFVALKTEVVGRGLVKLDTEWDRLLVTFGKFSPLPINTGGAQQLTWFSDASCQVAPFPTHRPYRSTHRPTSRRARRRPTSRRARRRPSSRRARRRPSSRRARRRPSSRSTHHHHHHRYHDHHSQYSIFPGNRYVLGTDETTRVLYSAGGLVAGMQATIPAPINGGPQPLIPPWAVQDDDGDLLVTVYFKDPETVCDANQCNRDIIGDRLWILISDYRVSKTYIKVPLERKNLIGTKWVEGKCFDGMGVHYWYDVSPDMDCNNFYPVFLLYSQQDGRLKAFGFAFGTKLDSTRWENPSGVQIRLFFQPQTLPKCLLTKKDISTQHVFLSDPRKLRCN